MNGTVDEYYIDGYSEKKTDLPVTQINARDDKGGKITVKSSNQSLPKPYKIKMYQRKSQQMTSSIHLIVINMQ